MKGLLIASEGFAGVKLQRASLPKLSRLRQQFAAILPARQTNYSYVFWAIEVTIFRTSEDPGAGVFDGYNFQWGNVVAGVEVAYTFTDTGQARSGGGRQSGPRNWRDWTNTRTF